MSASLNASSESTREVDAATVYTKLLVVLAGAVFAAFALPFFLEEHTDFLVFWAAGKAVLHGVNPYDLGPFRYLQESSGSDGVFYSFNYPLWLAVFFAPLGVLPIMVSKALWVALNLAALWLIMHVLRDLFSESTSRRNNYLVYSLVLLFWPVSLVLGLGQVSLIVLSLLVLGYRAFRHGHLVQAGIYLSLSTSKPHLVAICLLGLLSVSLRTRKRVMAITYMAGMILLFGIGFVVNGSWVSEWIRVTADDRLGGFAAKPFASVWKMALLIGLPQAEALAAVVALASVGVMLALFLSSARKPAELDRVFALSFAVTPLVLPYSLNYDLVLLLVPIAYIFSGDRLAGAWKVGALVAILSLSWLLLLLFLARGSDRTLDVLLPLVLTALMLKARSRSVGVWMRGDSPGGA